jgi:hypothetical protein
MKTCKGCRVIYLHFDSCVINVHVYGEQLGREGIECALDEHSSAFPGDDLLVA